MTGGIGKVLPNESLVQYEAAMKDFDEAFVRALVSGVDFTIRLEVHGNCGELLHARKHDETWRRPKGVEKEIERKRRNSRNYQKSSR